MLSAAYPPDPGGVATHVSTLAHGLVKHSNGVFIHIITSSKDNNDKIKGRDRLIIQKKAKFNIPNFDGRRVLLDDLTEYLMINWGNILPDLIHAHDFDSIQLGLMLKIAFKIPLVVTLHRAPIPWRAEKYKENPKDCYLEAVRLLRLSDAIVVPSKASLEVLKQQGFKTRRFRLRVIPHGITKWITSLRLPQKLPSEIGLDPERKLILCPVRADPHKDPETFIKAAGRLKRMIFKKQMLLFLLTVDPTDKEYRSLSQLATEQKLEVGVDIKFKSFNYKEMAPLYRLASACIIPSRRESFGQTVLEAFMCGTPVVAANTTALKEIIINRRNGLLFTDGDDKDLALKVYTILNDENLVQTLKENAKRDIEKKYNVTKMVRQHLKLYKEVLNKKGAALRGSRVIENQLDK